LDGGLPPAGLGTAAGCCPVSEKFDSLRACWSRMEEARRRGGEKGWDTQSNEESTGGVVICQVGGRKKRNLFS